MKCLLCFFLITNVVFSQGPKVIETNPIPQSMVTAPDDVIIITFDQPLDEMTVNQNTFMVFGRWSGPMDGTFSFDTSLTKVIFTPTRDFFYGEWVAVQLTHGIQNMEGLPLTYGYGFKYWTKSLPASLDLVYGEQINMRLPGEGSITLYGAYAGDINNDELSDLVVVCEDSHDLRLLYNDGANSFEPFIIIEMPNAHRPSTNGGADFNHDGLIDMAVGNHTPFDDVNVLIGDIDNIFENPINYQAGEGVRGIAIADLNGDGWADIATANRAASTISLIINDGTGVFEPAVNIDSGFVGETAIAASDLNDDGYVDLLVATYNSNKLVSLLNDGTGNFTVFDSVSVGDSPWMMAIGDVNGDGFVDAAIANRISDDISIVMSNGFGGLQLDSSYFVGDFPASIDLGDIDGDGDLDFISSNVGESNYVLWENDGSGTFVNPRIYPSPPGGGAACAILHDRNNDGTMDISLFDEVLDVVILYTNSPKLGTDDQAADIDLTLYPNPIKNILYITANDYINSVSTVNILGQELFNTNVDALNTTIDLSGYAMGTYFVRAQVGDSVIIKKIIKE